MLSTRVGWTLDESGLGQNEAGKCYGEYYEPNSNGWCRDYTWIDKKYIYSRYSHIHICNK